MKPAKLYDLSLRGWGSPKKGRPCREILLGVGQFILKEPAVPEEAMNGRRKWLSVFPLLPGGSRRPPATATTTRPSNWPTPGGAIARKVKGIMISPNDYSTSPKFLDLTAKAGIPVEHKRKLGHTHAPDMLPIRVAG